LRGIRATTGLWVLLEIHERGVISPDADEAYAAAQLGGGFELVELCLVRVLHVARPGRFGVLCAGSGIWLRLVGREMDPSLGRNRAFERLRAAASSVRVSCAHLGRVLPLHGELELLYRSSAPGSVPRRTSEQREAIAGSLEASSRVVDDSFV